MVLERTPTSAGRVWSPHFLKPGLWNQNVRNYDSSVAMDGRCNLCNEVPHSKSTRDFFTVLPHLQPRAPFLPPGDSRLLTSVQHCSVGILTAWPGSPWPSISREKHGRQKHETNPTLVTPARVTCSLNLSLKLNTILFTSTELVSVLLSPPELNAKKEK